MNLFSVVLHTYKEFYSQVVNKYILRYFRILVLVLTFLPVYAQALPINNSANDPNFIVISDIHFDPFIGCTNQLRPCALITRLMQSDSKNWAQIFAQDKGSNQISNYKQDTDFGLLRSLQTSLQSQHPNFVILLGDSLGHDIFNKYKSYSDDKIGKNFPTFIEKINLFLKTFLGQTFPDNTPIYPVIGNHEPDYFGKCKAANFVCQLPPTFYLKNYAKIWRSNIHSPDNSLWQQQFSHAGYYMIPATDAKPINLIVLNSVIYYSGVYNDNLDPVANEQLTWLQTQLQLLTNNKQKAWIIMHVPPIMLAGSSNPETGKVSSLWQPLFLDRFLAILQQYPQTVTAILSSHLHMDANTILFAYTKDPIVNFSTPAVSPVFDNNPSYKVFFYNPQTSQLRDVVTYYLPLPILATEEAKWLTEYDFRQVYLSDCSECSLSMGLKRIPLQQNNPNTKFYMQYYAVGHDKKIHSLEKKWINYWCNIVSSGKQDYQHCLQNRIKSRLLQPYINLLKTIYNKL